MAKDKIQLYDENDRWTEEAQAAVKRIDAVVKPLFNELLAEGYYGRELVWLFHDSAAITEIHTRILARNSKE